MADVSNVTDVEYYEQLMQFYNETIAFESKVFSASGNVRARFIGVLIAMRCNYR